MNASDRITEKAKKADEWLYEHRSELPEFEWVAANEDGLVDHDSSYKALIGRLTAAGVDLSGIAIHQTPPAAPKIQRTP